MPWARYAPQEDYNSMFYYAILSCVIIIDSGTTSSNSIAKLPGGLSGKVVVSFRGIIWPLRSSRKTMLHGLTRCHCRSQLFSYASVVSTKENK